MTRSVRALGLEARALPFRGASTWFVPRLWASFPPVRAIERTLQDLAPRVVHSDYHSLPFVLPACRRLGLPVLFTCWGWWFHPRPWQRGFYRAGPAAILAVSKAVKRGFLGTPPFMSPVRVPVLHPGVDPSRFRPDPLARAEIRQTLGCAPDTLLVTLVARFQSVKGHDVFLEAARQAAARSNRFRFAMAGENIFARSADDRLKGRTIRRIEADSSLRERVRFLGWVDQPEKVLAASDVVVCSSRFESFGMVLVEAMATEVPVVSTNVGGPAEIVIDGETGFLVPPGRPELIVQRLMRLSEDDGLRQRMGQAGRRRAIGEFGLDRYAAEFTRILEAAISGSTERG